MKIHATLRRRPTNITLSPGTLAKLDALARYKASIGEPKPSRAWMVERGIALFIDKMAKRNHTIRKIIEEVDAQYEKMAAITNFRNGNDSLRHLALRVKRRAL